MSNFSENGHRKTRCFQHRGVKTRGVLTTCFPDLSTLPAIFNTFFYSISAYFFTEFHARAACFSLKKYCVPALNTHKAEGNASIRAHISTVFQHGACVSKPCIPALPASLSSNPSPPKNAHGMCSSTAYVHFYCARIIFFCVLFAFLLCSSIFCVHFHCFGRQWNP